MSGCKRSHISHLVSYCESAIIQSSTPHPAPTCFVSFRSNFRCQSFLLAELKTKIQARTDPSSTWLETWCCCLIGFWHVISQSILSVVLQAIWRELHLWLSRCRHTCCPEPRDVESTGSEKEDGSQGTEFIVVEFNAWECAGSDILWAALITKIFDEVWVMANCTGRWLMKSSHTRTDPDSKGFVEERPISL